MARAAKRAPWVCEPGSAANRSPGPQSWARRLTPVTATAASALSAAGTASNRAASCDNATPATRSEERRVGKECRSGRRQQDIQKKRRTTRKQKKTNKIKRRRKQHER